MWGSPPGTILTNVAFEFEFGIASYFTTTSDLYLIITVLLSFKLSLQEPNLASLKNWAISRKKKEISITAIYNNLLLLLGFSWPES